MANEPVITVTGNLGADAEYKTTKSNKITLSGRE